MFHFICKYWGCIRQNIRYFSYQNITWSKSVLFRWCDGARSSLAPVKAILFGNKIILVPAATTIVKLSTLLFVRIVVPSLSIIVAFSQKRGQETGVLFCVWTKIA